MTFDELLDKAVCNDLVRMVFSKPRKDAFSQKMKVRPVAVKGEILFQATTAQGYKENNTYKEVHENLSDKNLIQKIKAVFPSDFSQALIETKEGGYTVLAGKKGNITIVKNKGEAPRQADLSHNRGKKYLIPEGSRIPFLEDLGVMTAEGKVVKSRYDKYRQLNRYLEFIDDVLDKLPSDKDITIVDFGCGKSYLTFALYHYLVELNKRQVKIIGLDLKSDVIKECNRLKDKYKFSGLTFMEGDIEHFDSEGSVDMVISLHACDTATDYAIYKGIKWGASVIMAVPCCQHELNKTANSSELSGVFQYGILKDRVCAAITDAMRANVLKQWGYDAQVLEFIDMEHTPKNILIRAVKGNKKMISVSESDKEKMLRELVGASITLEKLLSE
ncbi:MAG: SAM-dependent methyltransferase [Lachnospiraceae bacterium]|nr:SAM-dependent methyltransferase [Lachnospiraceae bacterium]